MWLYCLLCSHRELPMNQSLKQHITSVNDAVFPTSLLRHFCAPQPFELGWLWQDAQLLALIQGGHRLYKQLSRAHCCFADGAQCLADGLWAG